MLMKEFQKQEVVFQELIFIKKKVTEKEAEKETLENKWKREHSRPHISNFTGISTINAELPDDPNPLGFLDLYLDEESYKYLTLQINLYAA